MALKDLFKVVNTEQISVTGTACDLNPSGVERFQRISMVLNESSRKQPS